MLKITSNTKNFIEKQNGEIFVYQSDNAAYWVGYYLNKCHIDFAGYIDRHICRQDARCNEKAIYSVDKLAEYSNKEQIRIIVPSPEYAKHIVELSAYEQKYNLTISCLVAEHKRRDMQWRESRDKIYHINKLLAYFRKKLITKEIPTILSSDCMGGRLYEALDVSWNSPTINTGIYPIDLMKLCYEPKKYLNREIDEMYWKKLPSNPGNYNNTCGPVGRIDDIEVFFGHDDDFNVAKERWDYLRSNINWNRMVCLLVEWPTALSFEVIKKYSELSMEKILVSRGNSYGGFCPNSFFMSLGGMSDPNSAIENHFDLVGWINQDYM